MFKQHTRIFVNNYIDNALKPPNALSWLGSVW
jgi:hypothetical protein